MDDVFKKLHELNDNENTTAKEFYEEFNKVYYKIAEPMPDVVNKDKYKYSVVMSKEQKKAVKKAMSETIDEIANDRKKAREML